MLHTSRSDLSERRKINILYDKVPPTHIDDSLSKEVFHENGYFEKKLVREELYDLMLDPQERDNLIGEEDYQSVKDEMRQLLETWQKKTGDPLLTGQKICLPEGAICCTTDSYSTKTQVILPKCRKYLEGLRGVLQNNIK
mgnify:CR=1 FL=1